MALRIEFSLFVIHKRSHDGNNILYRKGGLTPRKDYSSASILCSTSSFPAINITGAGLLNHEADGTYLGIEEKTQTPSGQNTIRCAADFDNNVIKKSGSVTILR